MIFEYIEKHKILEIGFQPSGESFAELILNEPYMFVDVVSQSNYYISTIVWYERAKIHTGSKMGFGGPKDPRSPQDYFFSETSLCKTFDESTRKDEYRSYMDEIQSKYSGVLLFPSFQICRKTRNSCLS